MKKRRSDPEVIEHFHLALLQVLQARLGPDHYIVKGGVNLRYFFGSDRYSEDIDLDAVSIETWALEEKVDAVLRSTALVRILGAGGLEITDVTKPKQTGTTQRWKLVLAGLGRRDPIRTRIEFSHRGRLGEARLEAVPGQLVAPYALRPPSMQHYLADAAIEQKILALARRNETQARDVFDLELLLRTNTDRPVDAMADPETRRLAGELALELPVQAFEDQVLPFLDQEVAELYRAAGTWEQIQLFVAERLGAP